MTHIDGLEKKKDECIDVIKVEGPGTFLRGQTTRGCVHSTVGVRRSHQHGMLNIARGLLLQTLLAPGNVSGREYKHVPRIRCDRLHSA